MSAFVKAALELRAEVREAFEDYRLQAYMAAEEATNGYLLNQRGRRAQVDAYSLFMGNEARALAYASEELRDWWRDHPRPVFARYEREHLGEYFAA